MSIVLNNSFDVNSSVYSETKKSIVYQPDTETMRFDRELMEKNAEMRCSFATPITKEELFRQWDSQVKANQDKKMTIYEMLSARPFAKELMYSMVGSSKVYTFDEYVEEVKKMIQELQDK